MEIDPGTTIRELLDKLNIPPEAPKVIFLNGIHAQGDEVLERRRPALGLSPRWPEDRPIGLGIFLPNNEICSNQITLTQERRAFHMKILRINMGAGWSKGQ